MTGKRIEFNKTSFRSFFYISLGLLTILAGFPFEARAHGVYLFAWVEGETVYTESSFGGKKGVIGGLIKVFDPSGTLLMEGKTDEKGEFSFRIPQKTDLRIVLEATMGHRAEFLLEAGEVEGEKEGQRTESVDEADKPVSQVALSQLDSEQLKVMMEEVLEAKLKPIQRTLANMQKEKGPDLTEIIGGLGYIFGIMGLILYFKNRKTR